ncbi:hypothetical protein GEMRC1_009801 [Eukaryota sp. GEM-RC1]
MELSNRPNAPNIKVHNFDNVLIPDHETHLHQFAGEIVVPTDNHAPSSLPSYNQISPAPPHAMHGHQNMIALKSNLKETKYTPYDTKSVTDKVKQYSTWFWPAVASATALLILLGLILIVLPIFSSRSELKKAIRITANLEGSAIPVPSHTQEDKTADVLDFIESKLDHLNIDVTVRYSSTSKSYTVTLRTTTSFSVQDRVTLRDLHYVLSDRGQVSLVMSEIKDLYMSSLQFTINPFTESEMIVQLELYFVETLKSVIALAQTADDISVTVTHVRNLISFRLTLALNDYEESQVFDVEFLYTNDLAVTEAIDLLKVELSKTVELEVTDSDSETPLKAHVAYVLLLKNFHDFDITVDHLRDNEFRITVERGEASKSHTFNVPLVVVDLDEIQADLLELKEQIIEHEENNKFKCISADSAYTQSHQRRQALMQRLEQLVEDDHYMINAESVDGKWKISLSRASLLETLEITASFRDTQFTDVSQVSAAGNHFSAVLSSTGSLFMFGWSDVGQIGASTTTSIPFIALDNVKSVSTGTSHTLVLLHNGEVWGTGGNYRGQLGLGDTTNRYSFVYIRAWCNSASIDNVYAGFDSSAVLSGEGTAMCVWGYNHKNQISSMTESIITSARRTVYSTPVNKVAIGFDHLLVLRSTGIIRSRGGNWWGQLGDGTDIDRDSSITVLQSSTSSLNSIDDIFAGAQYSLALRHYSHYSYLFTWGRNTDGPLMFSTSWKPYAQSVTTTSRNPIVGTGSIVTLFLTSDGSVEGAGDGTTSGLLGSHSSSSSKISTGIENLSSMHCGSNGLHALGISSEDGGVVGWGQDVYGSFGTGESTSTSHTHNTLQNVGCVQL